LLFVNREDYRANKIPFTLSSSDLIIPQGGYGTNGVKGAMSILDHCEKAKYTHICCAAGTGTMTAGLLLSALSHQTIIAVSALKNHKTLEKEIDALLLKDIDNLNIIHDYHFGGYAKYDTKLISFMNEVYQQTNIPTDLVYTAKLFYAINDLAWKRYFPKRSKVLLIHSGGLQGNRSLSKGTLIF
jgi:1-aminocyclopropane-1-carboxylate deaminase